MTWKLLNVIVTTSSELTLSGGLLYENRPTFAQFLLDNFI